MIIGYDEKRGEKRGKHKKGTSWDGRGDCIDCTACVQVCPTGIDIRDGLQMECIACGLCVDACNDIMDKVERPRGLIRYDTANHMAAKVKGGAEKFRFLRPRTFYYGFILTFVTGILLYALVARAPIELHIMHDRNPVFVQLSSGEIRNGYTIKILNKTNDHKTYNLSVEGLNDVQIDVKTAGDVMADNLYVAAGSVGTYHVNLRSNVEPAPTRDVMFILQDNQTDNKDEYESIFVSKNDR